jgi:ectoine hydroxylase-related dioxygenase (phytanoyl-CoA dioxygenase family)
VLSRTECFCDAADPDGVSAFLKTGRLKQVCELLRGGRKHALLKEKINYKLAGAGGYLPHQDGYWQVERVGQDEPTAKNPKLGNEEGPTRRTRLAKDEEVCVCMIAVDRSDAGNGCPSVAPGWHTKGWIGLNTVADPAPTETEATAEDMEWQSIELNPGDLLLYGNLMPHQSAANL